MCFCLPINGLRKNKWWSWSINILCLRHLVFPVTHLRFLTCTDSRADASGRRVSAMHRVVAVAAAQRLALA